MTSIPIDLPRGPLMIDIAGYELTDLDRARLRHPSVGGLILFSRNYQSTSQLARLTEEVHALRSPSLLIAIDHEGGRVQRCRDGFTRLPAMHTLGEWWNRDSAAAVAAARKVGFVLAAELRACGVDLSFTPVLDLDWNRSTVVGSRSFHTDPKAVVELAGALIEGLRDAGMASCGKHFPGHGWAQADSHVTQPIDERSLNDLAPDIYPYRNLKLDAIMPAHVVYTSVDSRTAVFSPYWHAYIRNELKFEGVVFSDDLSMEGASIAGGVVGRVAAAQDAGCDMMLVCNAPDSVGELLDAWKPKGNAVSDGRVARLVPNGRLQDFSRDSRYIEGVRISEMLGAK